MKTRINPSFVSNITGKHALTISVDNTQVSLNSHCYSHVPGNQINVVIFDLSADDILQIADSIRKVALDLKPELNEALTVGAGI